MIGVIGAGERGQWTASQQQGHFQRLSMSSNFLELSAASRQEHCYVQTSRKTPTVSHWVTAPYIGLYTVKHWHRQYTVSDQSR